jgi:hypothetical protein
MRPGLGHMTHEYGQLFVGSIWWTCGSSVLLSSSSSAHPGLLLKDEGNGFMIPSMLLKEYIER